MKKATYTKLTQDAKDIYDDLVKDGFDDKSIKLGLEDGEALERIGLGDDDKEAIDELHSAL